MTDSAATNTDGYTSNVKPQNEHQRKRVSCETWWNYSPVNTTQFAVENIIKFQIPTTDVIFDMSRAFITVDYLMPVYLVGKTANGVTGERQAMANADALQNNATMNAMNIVADRNYIRRALNIPGILDAATIFSLTEMYMDGNLIWHNDYCQTQSRLWGLNKNDQWIDSQEQTYFRPSNTDDKTSRGEIQTIFNSIQYRAENDVPQGLYAAEALQSMKHFYVPKQLKIPLVSLYPQFEVMNGWPSFLVKQILYLQLTVSDVQKYLVDLISQTYLQGPYNVNDMTHHTEHIDNFVNFVMNGDAPDIYKPIFRYHGSLTDLNPANTVFQDVCFDLRNIVLNNPILYLPAHIPEFKERAEYIQMVQNGLSYGFKYYNVLSNTTYFGTGNHNQESMSLTFNSAVNNLEAVQLLFMRDSNEVIYEKPSISTIQTNLGNSWLLAASGTHVYNIYERDANLLTDLIKGWGQNDKNYMQTISSDIIHDYKTPYNYLYHAPDDVPAEPNQDYYPGGSIGWDGILELRRTLVDGSRSSYHYVKPMCGAYTLYFDVSPGDELGVASGQYARLINLRWNNTYFPNTNEELTRINFNDGKIYLCQQTFNTILITPSGVYIKNPFADEFSVKNTIMTYRNLNYDESGLRSHGMAVQHGGLAVQHGFLDSLTKIIGTGKKIYDGYHQIKPYLPGGVTQVISDKTKPVKKFLGWLSGNKSHGAMGFKVRAMRKLGPDGYKEYQHKIDKYAAKPWSHKLLLRDLRKQWGVKTGNGDIHYKGHGIGKYLPGSKLHRFIFDSFPRITPGWRGRWNNRPPRLQPFARFNNAIPGSNGSMDYKHGLTCPYHGFLDRLKGIFRRKYHKYVPEGVREALKPFENPAKELVHTFIEKGKDKLRERLSPETWSKAEKAYRLGRKLYHESGADKYVNRAINQRFASHGRRAYKKWAARTLSHGFFMGPHMRRMHKFYAKHYGRKANNRALKLERLMWAGGNKRVNDGQF